MSQNIQANSKKKEKKRNFGFGNSRVTQGYSFCIFTLGQGDSRSPMRVQKVESTHFPGPFCRLFHGIVEVIDDFVSSDKHRMVPSGRFFLRARYDGACID